MKIVDYLRQKGKAVFDRVENVRLKETFLYALPYWVGAVATGLMAVMYAKIFNWAEQGALLLFRTSGFWMMLITPVMFLLAWWVVKRWAPLASGSGIPQVTASIQLMRPGNMHLVNKLLSLRIIFIKILSSTLMALGGGVIGREGPTIQISASIFKFINDHLPEWYPRISRKNMLVTGAAAGLASAFNTPLGGIVFAIESLTKTHFNFFKSALLTGVIIAGLTALNLLGPYLFIGYPNMNGLLSWIFFPVMVVAGVAGLTGSGLSASILRVMHKRRSLKKSWQHVLWVAASGFILAALAIFVHPEILGSGKEIMVNLLFTAEKVLPWHAPLLRFVGMIISFTAGAAGGIFAPALSLGATVGSVVSGIGQLEGANANLLILCGMAACLTGITRSPFTNAILVNEMTNSHNVIFYIMLSALVANLISNLISKKSFYDSMNDIYIRDLEEEERIRHVSHSRDSAP